MITREFKLYLNAGVGVAPVINANQFDQDEEWIFTLLQSDGTVYTPSTGAIIGLKQDGTTILNAGTVNEDGQVVITETEQMTAVPGSNLFEILIDGNTHGTANFVVFVERRPGDIDNPSASDISLFQEAISAAGNVTQFQADISALQSGLSQETQTRQAQDTSLASQIAQEASTRSQQDAVLQAEIDQIIAPSGEAPSAAEVQNARIGVDGTTYDTLGNAIRTQVSDLKNAFNDLDSLLFDTSISLNRFDESLITSETITSGKQLNSAGSLIDNANVSVTPFLTIEGGKQYSIGLVPAYGSASTPWMSLPTGICFYDEEQTAIPYRDGGSTNLATFTTPASARYCRFNIMTSSLSVNIIKSRNMLVYGDSMPTTYSAYTGDSKTPKLKLPIEYSLSGGILTVTSGYGDGNIVVEFGRRGPNNLPDFRYITADGRQKYNNSTDWFGPFVLEALSNIDGDDINNSTYTGGNHNYANTGSMDSTATARNLSLAYYADGKSLSDGDSGFCSSLEIAWKNRVQAFNTRKADGTGREVLEERHTLKFDGTEWEAYVEIEALENLFCRQYYGFQCAVTQYPTIYMIGASYRKPFTYTSPHDSGNYNPNIYIAHDTNDRLEMEVDRTLDLGRGALYGTSGTQGFRTSGSKGYTYFITQKNLEANDVYSARGWYRFIPQS